MLKEELRKLQPSIPDILPHGAINTIEERTGKTRQSVTRMLRGEIGNDSNIRQMLKIVAEIADNEAGMQQNLAETIRTMLTNEKIILPPEKVQASYHI